jgi:hypothetical protein
MVRLIIDHPTEQNFGNNLETYRINFRKQTQKNNVKIETVTIF